MATDKPEQKSNSLKTLRRWLFIISSFVVFVIIWLKYPLIYSALMLMYFPDQQISLDIEAYFGNLEVLFSGLALAGVIVAIGLQIEQMNEQQSELEKNEKMTRNTIELQQDAAEVTLLTITPIFEPKLTRQSGQTQLTLRNPSQNPGIDVEILLVFVPTDKNLKPIVHHARYSYFPSRRQVSQSFFNDEDINYENIFLFIQYKSGLGKNYHYLYEYYPEPTNSQRYRIKSTTPDTNKYRPRIRFSTDPNDIKQIWLTGAEDIPKHLNKLKNALESARKPIIGPIENIKDMGDWQELPNI